MSEISKGNPLDQNRSGKVKIKKTKFPIHVHKYGTYRFGEYGTIGAFNGIANDSVKLRQILDVNTYTLKAPLLTPITMNRVYTQVPRMAMLPNAWPLIYVNPSIGDDIDASEYGTSVKQESFNTFIYKIGSRLDIAYAYITSKEAFTKTESCLAIKQLLEELTINELIFSNGSLVNAMGAHLARLWPDKNKSFDRYYDEVIGYIKETWGGFFITIKNKSYVVDFNIQQASDITNTRDVISYKRVLEELRDGETIQIAHFYAKNGSFMSDADINTTMIQFKNKLTTQKVFYFANETTYYNKPFDIARLWSYQLSCAEFFTNDKVDYIYSADIFRNYIGTIVREYLEAFEDVSATYYVWNGQSIEKDWLCANYFTLITNLSRTGELYPEILRAYLFALFKYNRSLKYKDYFTGSRTRPVAIGDTNINVTVNDTVEVIDVVKNIQKQRFLNIVNKIPRDLKGYTKGIMGKDVAPDWHNPLFLAKISEAIYGQETENTGEAQLTQPQTRTSVLKNEGNRIQVEFNLDRDSIIVGFVYFDIPRAYSKGVERSFMDVDRYDYFNPYMQYTGDQPVYREEIDASQTGTFAYQGAYMHMKQQVNDAFGGFIENLQGWTFLDQYIEPKLGKESKTNEVQGPDFIRSRPSELDRFYISLSGDSLASYFHFIIDIETHYEAVRPMAYKPEIL